MGDEDPYRGGFQYYPVCKVWYIMFVSSFLGLTFLGSQSPEEPFKIISRYLTVMHFRFFIFLPFVKRVDNWIGFAEIERMQGCHSDIKPRRTNKEWDSHWLFKPLR